MAEQTGGRAAGPLENLEAPKAGLRGIAIF